ncbi:MAG: b-brl protein [Ignavibacteria bacterium]|nr:b-brl protein [Ignavibacteria bacterium]
MRFLKLLPILILIIFNANLQAQEQEQHEAGMFLGYVKSSASAASGFTFGLDYEFKFDTKPIIGIGGLLEFTFGKLGSTMLGLPIYIHPNEEFKVWIAPFIEIPSKSETISDTTNNFGVEVQAGNHIVFRLGVSYAFDIEGLKLAPTVCLDLIENHINMLAGLSFSYGF